MFVQKLPEYQTALDVCIDLSLHTVLKPSHMSVSDKYSDGRSYRCLKLVLGWSYEHPGIFV